MGVKIAPAFLAIAIGLLTVVNELGLIAIVVFLSFGTSACRWRYSGSVDDDTRSGFFSFVVDPDELCVFVSAK